MEGSRRAKQALRWIPDEKTQRRKRGRPRITWREWTVDTFWRDTECMDTTYFVLNLYHNCDSTTMRLRYDYDEKLTFIFCSRQMEAAGERDTS